MSTFVDVYFYLDLTKEIIKKKEILKAIKYYISEKNKTNLQGHYGLLLFQELGNPVFITDKKDSDIILNAIEENWKNRPKSESFFENGCFYIFSYIAETVRKKSKRNRIIIITDTPSDVSEDYTEALFGLVSKIKVFPTFIDIIRISEGEERFFTDDVKLNIIANDTMGGIFYITDKKDFFPIIKKLVKDKQLVGTFNGSTDSIKIKKEDYFFYSHLAKKLILAPSNEIGLKCNLCQEEICPVCTDLNDKLVLCEECSTPFHGCCITNYTIQHNIGIPHIFRCPNCNTLLQIDQDDIVAPEDDQIETVEEYLDEDQDIAMSEEESEEENFVESNAEKEVYQSDENDKVVRIGGFFGKYYTVKKEGDKLIYQRSNRTSTNNNTQIMKDEEETEKAQYWNPSEHKKPTFLVCPECGSQVQGSKNKKIVCSFCGNTFDN